MSTFFYLHEHVHEIHVSTENNTWQSTHEILNNL